MSAIRKLGEFFIGFLFVMGMVLSISTYNLIQLSTQDTLEEIATEIFEAQSDQIEIGEEGQNALDQFSEQCEQESSGSMVFSEEGIEITCEDIEEIKEGDITEFVVSKYIEDVYTQEHDCDIIDCVIEDENPIALISESANAFYKELLNYLLVFTTAMGVIFVVLIKRIDQKFKEPGFALLWASVPFIIVSFFIQNIAGTVISEFLPAEIASSMGSVMEPVTKNLIDMAFMIYVYIAVIGALLVVIGFLINPITQKLTKKK